MPRSKRSPPPGFTLSDRHPRRRTEAEAGAASAVAAGGGDLSSAFERCRELLDKLLNHEDGWVFSAPVDARALGLRDYYTVVRDPMDLGTVLNRLVRRRYADPYAFAADVRLTFRNAMSYNDPGDPVYESAHELSEIFEAGWAPFLASLSPPPLPRAPPMDAERKAKLTNELLRMPEGVQESAAAVLKARSACLVEKGVKVQVDLGKADATTLDELDRLFAGHILRGRRSGRPGYGPMSTARQMNRISNDDA